VQSILRRVPSIIAPRWRRSSTPPTSKPTLEPLSKAPD
jgi:hypothetical protein